MDIVTDYYLDPTTGKDNDDGLTKETAWRSVNRLNEAIQNQEGSKTYLLCAGSYLGEGIKIENDGIDVVLEFEENVVIFNRNFITYRSGLEVENCPNTTVVANLRGATFLGSNVSSANGIGTNNQVNLTVNGSSATGEKACFMGFDDGVSFHSSVEATERISDIQIYDCVFKECVKSAYAHVNDAWGEHYGCEFYGMEGASLGIGVDTSSQKSYFEDCKFIPATNLQRQTFDSDFYRCIFAPNANRINMGVNTSGDSTFTECYLNCYSLGLGSFKFKRCYGYFDFLIRGPADLIPSFNNCIFHAYNASRVFANGTTDSDGVNWLGGKVTILNTVLIGYRDVVTYFSNEQLTHINSNWYLNFVCLFDNDNNFEEGIELGLNLLEVDPLTGDMSDASFENWALLQESPLIGAGLGSKDVGFSLAFPDEPEVPDEPDEPEVPDEPIRAIIVEDGTGVLNANSYLSEEQLAVFASSRGFSLPSAVETIQQFILRGMDYLDWFTPRLLGEKTNPDQALAFPRKGVCIDGVEISEESIPLQLVKALLFLVIEQAKGTLLFPAPQTDSDRGVVVEQKVGPLTRKFSPFGIGIVNPNRPVKIMSVHTHLVPLLGTNNIKTIRG